MRGCVPPLMPRVRQGQRAHAPTMGAGVTCIVDVNLTVLEVVVVEMMAFMALTVRTGSFVVQLAREGICIFGTDHGSSSWGTPSSAAGRRRTEASELVADLQGRAAGLLRGRMHWLLGEVRRGYLLSLPFYVAGFLKGCCIES